MSDKQEAPIPPPTGESARGDVSDLLPLEALEMAFVHIVIDHDEMVCEDALTEIREILRDLEIGSTPIQQGETISVGSAVAGYLAGQVPPDEVLEDIRHKKSMDSFQIIPFDHLKYGSYDAIIGEFMGYEDDAETKISFTVLPPGDHEDFQNENCTTYVVMDERDFIDRAYCHGCREPYLTGDGVCADCEDPRALSHLTKITPIMVRTWQERGFSSDEILGSLFCQNGDEDGDEDGDDDDDDELHFKVL